MLLGLDLYCFATFCHERQHQSAFPFQMGPNGMAAVQFHVSMHPLARFQPAIIPVRYSERERSQRAPSWMDPQFYEMEHSGRKVRMCLKYVHQILHQHNLSLHPSRKCSMSPRKCPETISSVVVNRSERVIFAPSSLWARGSLRK